MRMRERGIGNLPFIAVLVLFVIAVALFFVKQNEADDNDQKYRNQLAKTNEQVDKVFKANQAYDALVEMTGLKDPALQRTDEAYPAPDAIKETIRTYLMKTVEEVSKKSEARIQARVYQVPSGGTEVKVVKGDTTLIVLYGTPMVRETVNFASALAPLGEQFRWAAEAIQQNNQLFEQQYEATTKRTSELQTKVNEIQGKYESDVQTKAQQYDTEKQRADQLQDQVNNLVAQNDKLNSDKSEATTQFEKERRTLLREIQALKTRLINEKVVKDLMIAEDPKDGEVLLADPRKGLVYINRGRDFRVSRGTKFTVWRTGKGGRREDIAVIRVIKVDDTRSTCNVLEVIDPRIPVAQGQNISNPFYDPFKQLTVYIYGDLKYYPTDVAKRRLAESGAVVAGQLDERVNVIVLGEPPVTVSEDLEGEEDAAAAERAAAVEREKRLREVRELAASIGAVVVTEEVLRTFISY